MPAEIMITERSVTSGREGWYLCDGVTAGKMSSFGAPCTAAED